MIIAQHGNVTICGPGPTEVIHEKPQEPIWCFHCRKRLIGVHRLISETGMSWYDPWWEYACAGCGEDHRLGFGRVWVWDE